MKEEVRRRIRQKSDKVQHRPGKPPADRSFLWAEMAWSGRVAIPCHLQSLDVVTLERARQLSTAEANPEVLAAGMVSLYWKGVCVAPLWAHYNKKSDVFWVLLVHMAQAAVALLRPEPEIPSLFS